MRKIVKKRQLFNKKIVLNIILVLFMFLSIGYSTLSTNLNILGNLEVKKYYEHTFYNVLAKEAETGGLARKYTGAHHDSFIEEPSKDIYYWTVKNNDEAAEVIEKNNVIFAGQCFQMIRTTDTGGVKMIYNGEANDGKCLKTRENHVGYNGRSSQNLSSNYYYGTSYIYDESNKTFKISGTMEQAIWDENSWPNLIGKYTCKSSNADDTCQTIYLIESYHNLTNAYAMQVSSNSHYSQYGALHFNASASSLSYVGYMYNSVYQKQKCNNLTENMLSSYSLSLNFYYATSYDYNVINPNKYSLVDPYQISSVDDYSSLVGKYTFRSNSDSYSNNKILYIADVSETNMYCIEIADGNNLNFYNYTYTYGDSYVDNGDGTYTINNPITINKSDYYNHYNNMKNKYVCKNMINNSCNELWHATNNIEVRYLYYFNSDNKYVFANNFTYDFNTEIYRLSDDKVILWDLDNNNSSDLSNYHYTCFNSSDECANLSYVFGRINYITLSNGESIEDAKNKMLYNSDINKNNSSIKMAIDAWYEQYILDYSEYLEETVFCNDRIQRNADINGWNPNGGNIANQLYFNNSSSLLCQNTPDRFSTLNDNAKLKYNVGLMSNPEMGYIPKIMRMTGKRYWLGSPHTFDTGHGAYISVVNTDGSFHFSNVDIGGYNGVRPAISLRPGLMYESGDGSMANPYMVKYD